MSENLVPALFSLDFIFYIFIKQYAMFTLLCFYLIIDNNGKYSFPKHVSCVCTCLHWVESQMYFWLKVGLKKEIENLLVHWMSSGLDSDMGFDIGCELALRSWVSFLICLNLNAPVPCGYTYTKERHQWLL